MHRRSEQLPPTGYLRLENPDHVRVLEVLDACDLLSPLALFNPCVEGTYPLGLAVAGSDIPASGAPLGRGASRNPRASRVGHRLLMATSTAG